MSRPAPDAELALGDTSRIALGALWLAGVPLTLLIVALGTRLRRARADRTAATDESA